MAVMIFLIGSLLLDRGSEAPKGVGVGIGSAIAFSSGIGENLL
jgi:hypothetical protein